MPITWDDATDKKFLLNMIHILAPEKIPWVTIRESMGEEYTMESIKSRYKKLKAQAKTQFGDPPTLATGGKGEKGEKSTRTKRKAKKAVAAGDDDEGEQEGEGEEMETPSKKMKVKKEESEDAEGELV